MNPFLTSDLPQCSPITVLCGFRAHGMWLPDYCTLTVTLIHCQCCLWPEVTGWYMCYPLTHNHKTKLPISAVGSSLCQLLVVCSGFYIVCYEAGAARLFQNWLLLESCTNKNNAAIGAAGVGVSGLQLQAEPITCTETWKQLLYNTCLITVLPAQIVAYWNSSYFNPITYMIYKRTKL